MKLYSGLVVFAGHGIDSYVLTTINGDMPKWEITEDSDDSLRVAQESFSFITGISTSWNIQLRQSGLFENTVLAEKIAIVVYTTYFPAKQDLSCKSNYKWTKFSELHDSEFKPILMYLAAQRS